MKVKVDRQNSWVSLLSHQCWIVFVVISAGLGALLRFVYLTLAAHSFPLWGIVLGVLATLFLIWLILETA